MAQVSKHQLNSRVFQRIFALLPNIISSLKNQKEADTFIQAIFSKTEQVMIAKRFAIIFMLEKGYSYSYISGILKVSYGTIAKMSEAYKHSSDDFKKQIRLIMAKDIVVDLLNEVGYQIAKLLPPKGGNWSRWRSRLEKQKLSSAKPF